MWRDEAYLLDMLLAARKVLQFVSGWDRERFLGSLPPFLGIRIKPFDAELAARSVRTLDLFLTALVAQSGGRLPAGFVVTLPKVKLAGQVADRGQIVLIWKQAGHPVDRKTRFGLWKWGGR